MVNFCCVPCCSNNSIRDSALSYFGLPLRNKALLKQWIHSIGRKNLPINANTRVCSHHFCKGGGRQLRPDEVPSLNLPPALGILRPYKEPRRKSPMHRQFVEACSSSSSCHVDDTPQQPSKDVSVQTEESMQQVKKELADLNLKFVELSKELEKKEVKIRG